MERLFFAFGACGGLTAVALGAFAAHALKGKLPPDLFEVFEVGARYHMYHALALLGVGWAVTRWPGAATAWAGRRACRMGSCWPGPPVGVAEHGAQPRANGVQRELLLREARDLVGKTSP